jgi:hypothetical protein
MNAAHPAARPFLALHQLLDGTLYPSLTRLYLHRVIDPADELIAPERRQTLP